VGDDGITGDFSWRFLDDRAMRYFELGIEVTVFLWVLFGVSFEDLGEWWSHIEVLD